MSLVTPEVLRTEFWNAADGEEIAAMESLYRFLVSSVERVHDRIKLSDPLQAELIRERLSERISANPFKPAPDRLDRDAAFLLYEAQPGMYRPVVEGAVRFYLVDSLRWCVRCFADNVARAPYIPEGAGCIRRAASQLHSWQSLFERRAIYHPSNRRLMGEFLSGVDLRIGQHWLRELSKAPGTPVEREYPKSVLRMLNQAIVDFRMVHGFMGTGAQEPS